jgi:hypothetical protein
MFRKNSLKNKIVSNFIPKVIIILSVIKIVHAGLHIFYNFTITIR